MIFGLLRAGRMLGQAASSGPKRPPADPKTSAIAWAVVGIILVSFWWWPIWIIAGVALLLCALASGDRKPAPRVPSPPSAPNSDLARLLAKYDDNRRRKP